MGRGKKRQIGRAAPALELPENPTLVRRHWQARTDGLGGRRAKEGFDYEAYVPRSIATLDPLLEASLVEAIAAADQACRELNEDPPALVSLEALARQLLRAEAVASSRIENLIVSHRSLARAFFEPEHRDTASEVVANVRATERAIELASSKNELTLDTLIEIHRILFTGTSSEDLAGVIRDKQNWIGGTLPNPRDADFIPPPEEYVEPALEDLLAFMNRDDLPATLQAAITHAQFETIHPFADGNGRVGRTLIHVIFRRRGIAPRYVPPVSLVLAGRSDEYIKGLTAYRQGQEEVWYETFADAVEISARKAREFADRVAELQEQWFKQAGKPRPQAGARKLIAALPGHPVVDVGTVQELTGAASQETARTAINRLVDARVLRQVGSDKKRNRLWESVGLFDLLDSFERELAPTGQAPRGTS
jgi:Fic family protein